MDEVAKLLTRVRTLRERLGLRQADLAKEAGVTRQTIIAIEKGRLNPSVVVALRIARALREPVDYVFYLERKCDEGEAKEKKEYRGTDRTQRKKADSVAARVEEKEEEGEESEGPSDHSEPPALFDFG